MPDVRKIVLTAALLASFLMLAPAARAEMIGTPDLLAQHARVDGFLARADVQRQLEAYGVGPGDAAARVAGLTGAELQALSSRIDSLPAGAGNLTTLEVVLIVLLIVVLI